MASAHPMEMIVADLDVAKKMFEVLEQAAAIELVHEVYITYRLEGGDLITVGYGEQAEPAIVAVEAHVSDDCPQCGWAEDCVCDKPTTRIDGQGASDAD